MLGRGNTQRLRSETPPDHGRMRASGARS